MATLLVAVCSAAAFASGWPQLGGSAAHLSYGSDPGITAANAPTMGVHWMANLFSADLGSPVVAWNANLKKNVAYVGNERSDLFALDAKTGEILWSVNLGLGDALRATPAVASDGSVWVATHYNPTVYKLNGATGAVLCSNKAVLPIDASPTFASPPGGVPSIYFESVDSSTANGPLVALRTSDCSRIYTFTHYRQIAGGWATPSYGVTPASRPLVLVGTADVDDTEYAIDAVTGALVWRYTLTAPPGDYDIGDAATISAPGNNGFSDGVAYVNNKYGDQYALDLTTGAKIWETDIYPNGGTRTVRSGAALDENMLVIGKKAGVVALNATTGAILWQHSDRLEVVSTPAIAGPAGSEVVTYGDIDGSFHVLDLASGKQLYSYQSGGYITSSPAIADGNILIASSDGFLYAFSAAGSNAQAPVTAVTSPQNSSTVANPNGNITVNGTATDPLGVFRVEIAVQSNGASGPWYNAATNTYNSAPVRNAAVLARQGATSTAWSFQFPVPASGGGYQLFANSVSTGGIVDRGAASSFAILPSSSEPRLTVSSMNPPPSGIFNASARSFNSGETVQFSLLGKVVATATTAPGTGHVPPVAIAVPSNAYFGPTALTAKGLSSGKVSSVVIDITNEWTQLGYSATRLGHEPHDSVLLDSIGVGQNTVLNRAWYYSTGSPVNASPAIVNGVAYIGDDSGTVSAITTNTGAPRWTYVLPSHAAIHSSPAVDSSGNIIVGSDDGNLYQLGASGTLIRSIALGGRVGSPANAGGEIVVASDNGNIYDIADSTGAIVWMATISAPVTAPVSYDAGENTVIAGDQSGAITALDATTGARLWKVKTTAAITASAAIDNGTVIVGSQDGYLYALDEKTGAQKWQFKADSPIIAGAGVFIDGEVSVGDKNGTLYLLTAGGKVIYVQAASIHQNSPIVGLATVEGNVLAESANGLIVVTRQSGGAANTPWTYRTKAGLASTPAIIDGAVYVAAADGGLYAFTPEGRDPVPARKGPVITITDAWTCTTP
ncbi:MAG: PQQ-binding-like beta-propeller repeat protein [Candidatus Eremiobacteraeota bacterium]|nr:PQQ-binding-like beta-propeller repeat protein [Candidatus Eremiobacteraeota bacterium]